jgi:hypothetical protein
MTILLHWSTSSALARLSAWVKLPRMLRLASFPLQTALTLQKKRKKRKKKEGWER